MGGRPWECDDGGKRFTRVLFRYFPNEVKLAFCIFAQPESDWTETEDRNIEMFNSFMGSRTIAYKTMTAENFAEVSSWADVIYIPGGNPKTLHDLLIKCGDISKLWNKKVIAGSSAGADLFCTNYVYLQDKTFGKGLDWVKATCVPHWRDKFRDYTSKDWDWAESEALRKFPELPVLCIPEGEFVEFSVT